jgi:hypothetical protein
MKRFLLTISALIFSCFLYSQMLYGQQVLKQANDFTITTTDGITRNLYNTLDSGKTVFVDLFYTTCSWCQFYSPIIEEIYQNTGAGQEDIEFWGISNNLFDTNNVIDQYKTDYNVTNPCAGPWGGGTTAFSIIVNGQNFQGFPTYCVICPDRTLYFDPCYPPTVNGFDPFFESCDTLTGINNDNDASSAEILSVFPNPARDEVTVVIVIQETGPVEIEFTDLLGIKVISASYHATPGEGKFIMNTGKLSNGIYFVKIIQNGLSTHTHKILISR